MAQPIATTVHTEKKQAVARLNYLHIAPRKVRLLADTLKGLPLADAEAALMMQSQRSALPLLKLIRSAAANGVQMQNMNRATMRVENILVDKGPILKRSLPRAQGSATPIHKILSHVTVFITEGTGRQDKYVFAPKPKKETGPKKTRVAPKDGKKETKSLEEGKSREPGFFKKVFRRKSI